MNKVFYYTEIKNCDSSVIKYLYYNIWAAKLVVRFQNNQQAVYKDVPAYVWTGLKNASSVGQYYNYYIKGIYSSTGESYNNFTLGGINGAVNTDTRYRVRAVVEQLVKADSLDSAVEKFNSVNSFSGTVVEIVSVSKE